ncbi:MAG TPA: NADH-ubiquinone oxidoreductase-F iron-sulfur binding region domain-containing protein [Gaiellaceae bacterium]|nr:NADH-ubiquinone oxidoreductase-F iron-sulfur binding region domain-containing protein [Gaiellaceae bacterium]
MKVADASSRQPAGGARLLAAVGHRPTFDRHVALYGELPAGCDLIALIERAGLRGRGGAGFPTATKLAAVARRRGAVVVVNAVEGEPASKKDRSLLRVAPHLVLDGAALAAEAVGATQVIIATSTYGPELTAAIGERTSKRYDSVTFDVEPVEGGFVAGEETAVLSALSGRRANPTLKPPFPAEQGLGGAPTLVQNVETLGHIALIARFGSDWFGRGTALVTLSGSVAQPGVHEIPVGATLAEVITQSGGTTAEVAAYLVGGYFGRWIPAAAATQTQLMPDILGAGVIVALPSSTCAAAECARVVQYLAHQSAGQCGPCLHGLAAISDAMHVEQRGDSRPELKRLGRLVSGRGACRHPDGVVRFVDSALAVFAEEFARHANHRGCGKRLQGILQVGATR